VNPTILIFVVMIVAMLLMTRSAKNKQRQAVQMRESMQPGSGVRTIGGLVAEVKEVRDTTVLLEIAPGVHTIYAKNAIGAVLTAEEYDRLVNNDVPLTFDEADEAEASAADAADGADEQETEEPAGADAKINLAKSEQDDEAADPAAADAPTDAGVK
jgi:preprotein translocase subunit YajC